MPLPCPLIRQTCTKSPKAGDVYDQRPSMAIGLPGRRPASCAERFSAFSGVRITLIGKSRLGLSVSHSVNTRMSPYREEPECAGIDCWKVFVVMKMNRVGDTLLGTTPGPRNGQRRLRQGQMPKVFQIARTLEFPAITRALANDWVDKIGKETTLLIRFLNI